MFKMISPMGIAVVFSNLGQVTECGITNQATASNTGPTGKLLLCCALAALKIICETCWGDQADTVAMAHTC